MAETIERIQHELKIILRFILVPIALFFLFKKLVFELFASTFVKFIFSKVGESSLINDWATLFIFLVVVLFFSLKIFNGAKIPNKWWYLAFTYCVVYFFFRFPSFIDNEKLEFTTFKTFPSLYLSDITIAVSLIFGFWVFIQYCVRLYLSLLRKKHIAEDAKIGFTVEEPTIIRTDDDLLGRRDFIVNLADQIKNTKTGNGSFPIGISASWGSGKTTFLKSLLNEFKGDKNFVIIELNVWKEKTPNLIIETLFKELREKLKDYSFTLNNKLPEYASNLTKVSKEGFETFKTLSELAFPNESIEKQFETISKAIGAITKKIIISIDDIDRLDKEEVYEVIRLIRDTANFANTFFIITYDRNYILEAIAKINSYKSHTFLEKIFQLEFSLPPISEKIIQNEIRKRLYKFLLQSDQIILDEMINGSLEVNVRSKINLTSDFILNIRDVIRFVNSLLLNYNILKGEVYFPDFYNLEIIRFKYPEIFSEFYRQRYNFLKNDELSNIFLGNNTNLGFSIYTYYLSKDSDDNSEFFLKKTLKEKKEIYKIDNQEIKNIVTAFDKFFPGAESTYRQDFIIDSLSAVKPSIFDRYFIISINERLSNLKFSKFRVLSSTKFNAQITEWSKNIDTVNDLREKFVLISEFDNKEDFEKIVKGVLFFVDLPNPGKDKIHPFNKTYPFNKIPFDPNFLFKIIFSPEIEKIYLGTEEDFKKFLTEIFDSTDQVYIQTFLNFLLKHPAELILNKEEIGNMLLNNLKYAISKNNKLTKILWKIFISCEKHSQKYYSGNEGRHTDTYSIQEEAQEIMSNFILFNDLETFIQEYAIRKVRDNRMGFGDRYFIFEKNIKDVFGDEKIFLDFINNSSIENNIIAKDFVKFSNELNSNNVYKNNGVPINFFKHINVNKLD